MAKKILIFLILLLTFSLAVKQIGPFDSVDEKMIANWIWKMHENPFPVNQYPPLMLYLHFLLSLIYEQILLLLGFVNNHLEFVQSGYGYRFMVEAGRIIVALFATGMVYFVYRAARKFYNDGVAFAAVFILSFNQVLILHAHIFKTDIAASFLLTVAIYFMLKFHSLHRMKDFFLAAFVSGLAVATKYNVFPLVFVLALLIFLVRKNLSKEQIKRAWLLLPLVSGAGFFLAAPNWLLHPIANLKLFLKAYNLQSGVVYHFGLGGKDSAIQILSKIFANLFTFFGPFLMVLFIFAIGASILKKNSRDLLILTAFLLYILLFIWTGFYADRFCIPLYSVFCLLVGKAIFVDIAQLFTRYRLPWRIGSFILWGLLITFAATQFTANVKSFNQLKTQLKDEWVQTYRADHNLINKSGQPRIGSQHQTPRSSLDVRLRRIFTTKPSGLKYREPLNFILANRKYYEFFNSGREALSSEALNLDLYRPFFLFEKRKFQPWDYDYVFLYKISPELHSLGSSNQPVDLPRLFCRGQHTTYLPLQVYQKNPLFLKVEGRFLNHWLHCSFPLRQLGMYLFRPPGDKGCNEVHLSINGREINILFNSPFGFYKLTAGDLNKKLFYHDHVYQVEIKKLPNGPVYLVMEPSYKERSRTRVNLSSIVNTPLTEPIPQLFSKEAYPLWVKRFFQKTGQDLALQQFLNQDVLYYNRSNSLNDVESDFFPLQPGHYTLEIKGRQISDDQPLGPARLLINIYSEKSTSKITRLMSGELPMIFPLEMKEKLTFVKIQLLDLQNNNLLVREVILKPDYQKFIDQRINRIPN